MGTHLALVGQIIPTVVTNGIWAEIMATTISQWAIVSEATEVQFGAEVVELRTYRRQVGYGLLCHSKEEI